MPDTLESHGNDLNILKIKFNILAFWFEEGNGGGIHLGIIVLNAYLYLKHSKWLYNPFSETGFPLIRSVFIGFSQKLILKHDKPKKEVY